VCVAQDVRSTLCVMGDMYCESVPVQEFEVGAIYSVVVKEVRDYGLIVELAPGVDALLHKLQLSHEYVVNRSHWYLHTL